MPPQVTSIACSRDSNPRHRFKKKYPSNSFLLLLTLKPRLLNAIDKGMYSVCRASLCHAERDTILDKSGRGAGAGGRRERGVAAAARYLMGEVNTGRADSG